MGSGHYNTKNSVTLFLEIPENEDDFWYDNVLTDITSIEVMSKTMEACTPVHSKQRYSGGDGVIIATNSLYQIRVVHNGLYLYIIFEENEDNVHPNLCDVPKCGNKYFQRLFKELKDCYEFFVPVGAWTSAKYLGGE